jgi:Ca2+-transporting ATPase
VETLGAATVLCVDKTGTLTENKMSLRQIFASGKFYDIKENKGKDLPESYHKLIEYGILASQRDPFDPMEKALKNLGIEKLLNTEHMHEDWELVREYPLSSSLLSLSYVWKDVEKNEYIVGAKGAPEAILELCHLYGEEKKKQMENAMLMAREGFRILGVASARSSSKDLPEKQHDFNYELLGFVGLEDPVRTEVPAAVKECYAAGIRIVMITGDYQETAKNIGKQIGLKDCENVITGEELEKMPQEELIRRSKSTNIFARVVPEQKLLIVTAFKAAGEIVAMTGDGVNDAPALKASFIGIAMGERGTDVAREASSLVLLDDNFASIVEAIKVGRRIFDNLKKAMAYIVSVHIPIALMSLIPVLFQWKEMLLYPIHIVFLELIIDPACSIVFEREPGDKDIMQRKPRNPKERLFGKKTLTISVLQGLISFVIVMAVYKAALYLGESMVEIRTLCFITLIASNLMLIMTNRSWSKSILESFRGKNNALTWVVVSAVVFLMTVIYTPFLQKLFSFTAMKPQDFVIALCAGIAGVLWFELLKKVAKKYNFDLLKEKV